MTFETLRGKHIRILQMQLAITGLVAIAFTALAVHLIREAEHKAGWNRLLLSATNAATSIVKERMAVGGHTALTMTGLTDRHVLASATHGVPPDSVKTIARLNHLRELLSASIVYVMDKDGIVVASTTYDGSKSLTGNSYAFRTYFKGAMEGEEIVYWALGVTTFKRGIYNSSPIRRHTAGIPNAQREIVGVIVAKTGISEIEELLAGIPEMAFLVAPDNVVFAANRPEWLFASVVSKSSTHKDPRQYGAGEKRILSLPQSDGMTVIDDRDYAFVSSSVEISGEGDGWRIILLSDMHDWHSMLALTVALIGGLALMTLAAVALVANTRRRIEIDRRADERAQSMAALLQSKEHTARMFNIAPSGIFTVNMEQEVTAWNRAAEQITGYSADEVIGTKCSAFALTPCKHSCGMREHGGGSAIYGRECKIRTKEGKTRIISKNIDWLYDPLGNLTGAIESFDDITERHSQEEALIKSERLAAVGTLAGGVAHEFNNLNVSVLGYSELLLLNSDLPEKDSLYLTRIRSAALRAKEITQNLLSFAGNRQTRAMPCCLSEVVRESLAIVQDEYQTEGISFRLSIADVPETDLNSAEISQVVLNLLLNARHALIGREEQVVTIRTWTEDASVCLSVADTGCGILPADIPKVFSPFFSTKGEHGKPGTPQVKVKGTGLGLSVSHTIINRHNGTIEVESEVDEGTTFTIRLPISGEGEAVVQSESPQDEVSNTAGQARIIVLEDEDDVRNLLGRILAAEGRELILTDDGKEALRILGKGDIDLILLDLQMPKMSGLEFLREARQLCGDNCPQCLVLTGRRDSHDLVSLQEIGVGNMLFKPFSINVVREKVNALLSGR